MNIPIHQFIHTRLTADMSPRRKTGYQCAFFPKQIISSAALFEIEVNIAYSDVITNDRSGMGESRALTCFYRKLDDIVYLVLIVSSYCHPENKDNFGRSFNFSHGFAFPPKAWQTAPSPNDLLKHLEPHLLTNVTAMMSSPHIDRSTGDMRPLEIQASEFDRLRGAFQPLRTDFEFRLTLALSRLAHLKGNIVCKGSPDDVASLISRCMVSLPAGIRTSIGFNASYDGIGLGQYPIKVVGYQTRPPNGFIHLEIDCAQQTLLLSTSTQAAPLLTPVTIFEKWLMECRGEATSPTRIETAYALTELIEKGVQLPAILSMEPLPGFMAANRARVEQLLLQRMRQSAHGCAGLEQILIRRAMAGGGIVAMFTGRVDTLRLLDDYLKENSWTTEEGRQIIEWGRRLQIPVGYYPHISALLDPTKGIPPAFMGNHHRQAILIGLLQSVYRVEALELQKLGFSAPAMQQAEQKKMESSVAGKFVKWIVGGEDSR